MVCEIVLRRGVDGGGMRRVVRNDDERARPALSPSTGTGKGSEKG